MLTAVAYRRSRTALTAATLAAALLVGVLVAPARATDLTASITYAPSGAEVGSDLPDSTDIATFDPATALVGGDKIELTFPDATVLTDANIAVTDFTVEQAASGGSFAGAPTAPTAVSVDEGARTLTFDVDAASLSHTGDSDGLGVVAVRTSADAGGNEVRHPTTATTSASFSVATSTSAGGPKDSGTIGDVEFVHAAATQLAFTGQPSDAAAGAAISPAVTVAVQDVHGNTVTASSDDVTVAFGANPGPGTLSGTSTTAAVDGVATFADLSVDKVAAGYTLEATGGGFDVTSTAFAITHGAAAQLAVTTEPSASTVAGQPFATQPVVTVQDAHGNTVTDSTLTVTAALTTGDGDLSGTPSADAVAGVADFAGNDLSIDVAGSDKVLTFSSGALTVATSAAFTITAAPSSGGGTTEPDPEPEPEPEAEPDPDSSTVDVAPDADGDATAETTVDAVTAVVALRGVDGSGSVTMRRLDATPTSADATVVGAVSVELTATMPFDRAHVCIGYDPATVDAAGLLAHEIRLFHVTDGGDVDDITVQEAAPAEAGTVCGVTDSFSPFVVGAERVMRLGGADRVATAAALSAARFEPGVPVALLATADAFADALAAGPAAARLGGPLLLVRGERAADATLAELERLAPGRVVILGGAGAVPASVQAQVEALGHAVTRLSGADRYATAAAVSAATFAPGVTEVLVATGEDFPDALAGGAAAARLRVPVLLVTRDGVPAAVAEELARLAPRAITVLGGTAAVGDAVAEELAGSTDGRLVRVFGPDRYATAAAVGARYFTEPGGTVFVATGEGFADALAGVPAAALTGSPLLLVAADRLPEATRSQLLRMPASRALVLGMGGAVSDGVAEEVAALLR